MREEQVNVYRVLVQLGAFLELKRAEQLKKSLETQGKIVYINTAIINQMTYYKVLEQVGSYTEDQISKQQGGTSALDKANNQVIELRKNGKMASVEKAVLSKKALELKGKIIVIDPGHGGSDPGAIGPRGNLEKDLNLQVALLTKKLLLQEGATVRLTRETDTLISLYDRPNLANTLKANLFVSIHMNGFTNNTAKGTEVIYAKTPGSYDLANLMQKSFKKILGLTDRGIKLDSRGLAVLRKANIPAVLVEMAFITNDVEEQLFSSGDERKKAAQAIFSGCLAFLRR